MYATRTAMVLAVGAVLAGCGYINHGARQVVHIDTAPSGAQIEVDGRVFQTPADVELRRGVPHTVTARGPNGITAVGNIESTAEYKWQFFDLFTLPIVGNIADGVSGGDRELEPETLVIPLAPAAP